MQEVIKKVRKPKKLEFLDDLEFDFEEEDMRPAVLTND